MIWHPRSLVRATILVLFLLLHSVSFSTAQEAKPTDDSALREQTVYIPYTKLRDVFEKEGRGVFLPYDKFRELWKAAHENRPQPADDKPPVGALVTEATHEAVISRDVVKVTAKVKYELLGKGWQKVPLRLHDSAILSAKIGNESARVVQDPQLGYVLLLENKTDKAVTGEAVLEYAKSFEKTPGRNRVSFRAPLAPVSRWQVEIAEPGVKIDIKPLIAASDVPADNNQAGRSRLQAFVGAADEVAIEWTPRAEGAQGLTALAHVQLDEQVFVEETVTRVRLRLAYTVLRGELMKLVFDVPADQRVVNVFETNVKKWTAAPPAANQPQRVTVELFEPAKSTQVVNVELEKVQSEGAKPERIVPFVTIQDVGRQQGVVAVDLAEGLQADVARRAGLVQVDRNELPQSLAGRNWRLMYRYTAPPVELALNVTKIEPRVTVDTWQRVTIEPNQLTWHVHARYTIEQAGVFRLQWQLPPGVEVRQVRGEATDGVAPFTVGAHRVEGDAKDRLIVELSRQALGKVGLYLELSQKLTQPELLAPSPQPAALPLGVPQPQGDGLERADGRLVVYAAPQLRVQPTTTDGLRPTSFAEALAGFAQASRTPGNQQPVQAFAWSQGAVKLVVAAERRKPHITARQLVTVRVEPGVVRGNIALRYDILHSGVKTLRIDVPKSLATLLRNETLSVADAPINPPPADVAADYVAWQLTGQGEFLGSVAIKLRWEQPLEEFDVGKSVDIAVPHVQPKNVDRAWGQIVLTKAEGIDLQERDDVRGLRPIDPQTDLMDSTRLPEAARAFEFVDAWSLGLKATRYELETVKVTSIERALVRMVHTRSRETSVQALYRLRSARQRLSVVLPTGAVFDSEPLRVNGRAVPIEKGANDEFHLPLATQSVDEAVLVELRYSLKDVGPTFELPTFPEEPAIQQVYLSLYLPHEWAVVGFRGPWHDENVWRWHNQVADSQRRWGQVPMPRRDDTNLANWLREGLPNGAAPSRSFAADGQMYLFSTLRPANDATLSLRMIDASALKLATCLLVLVGGVILLRGAWGTRVVGLAALIAGLIVLAVFMPLLSHEIVSEAFIGAIALVLLLWFVRAVYQGWQCCRPRPVFVESPPAAPPPAPSEPTVTDNATEEHHE
ncbi:MAG: hypothetical protein JNM18_19375 [Planctomycetaceae bacterium]|nr:hypothetical protein [Planctomycetaceae bacterium]